MPVVDVEKPRDERDDDDENFRKHRKFDAMSQPSKLPDGYNKKNKRGFADGSVGWGVMGEFGSSTRDDGSAAVHRSTGSKTKMVKNEKGLWVKAEIEDGEEEEERGEGRECVEAPRGRGRGGGIPVLGGGSGSTFQEDIKLGVVARGSHSNDHASSRLEKARSRFKSRSRSRDKDKSKSRPTSRSSSRSSSRSRSGSSSRSRHRHRRRRRHRSRDRRSNDRGNRSRDRDRNRRRSRSRSRSRTRSRSRSRDRDEKTRRRNRSRSRNSRYRHRSDRDRDRPRDREGERDRDGHRDKDRHNDRKRLMERENASISAPVESDEASALTLNFTAAQVCERFLEVFSSSNQRRLDMIEEVFSDGAIVKSLKSDKELLNGKINIRNSFENAPPHPSEASKRVFIECSGGRVSYCFDFYKIGDSPGLGDPQKETVLLYRVENNVFTNVWGSVDKLEMASNSSLSMQIVSQSDLWSKYVVPLILHEDPSFSLDMCHFNNYGDIETIG